MGNQKTKKNPFEFLQFSVIGAANAGIDIGTLNLLLLLFPTEDKVLLAVFNTIAYSLAVANSYYWNAKITFKRKAVGNNRQRFIFFIQALISLGINNLVFIGSTALMENLGVARWLRYNIAKGLAMLLSFLASFFMIKYAVFKKRKTHKMK
ncbi:GtrA family protein [Virgibacillus kekensis]|uniref:GtrA family protein n=1 Tax=Virgibacillus kekensis TaxID=202261 RepID=A0ABV9DKW5_9BACI